MAGYDDNENIEHGQLTKMHMMKTTVVMTDTLCLKVAVEELLFWFPGVSGNTQQTQPAAASWQRPLALLRSQVFHAVASQRVVSGLGGL